MKFRVLSCSGSEAPGHRPGSFLIGDAIVLEMGSAASLLSFEEQLRVRDVLLTHAHLDHVKDVAFLAENVVGRIAEPIRIHGTAPTLDILSRHLLNGELWPDFTRLPGDEISPLVYAGCAVGQPFRVDGVTVTPYPADHCPGAVGFLLESDAGAIAFSGDTGSLRALGPLLVACRKPVRALLVELSFPNRLDALAGVSRHLTPARLAAELAVLPQVGAPVYVYHVKAPTREETLADLAATSLESVSLLVPGQEMEF